MTIAGKRYRNKLKNEFNKLLGGKCVCPGIDCWHEGPCIVLDTRCLQRDHINGRGNLELQKKFNHNVYAMAVYYIKHKKLAKKFLQLLCANCNWVKRHNKKEYASRYKKEDTTNAP